MHEVCIESQQANAKTVMHTSTVDQMYHVWTLTSMVQSLTWYRHRRPIRSKLCLDNVMSSMTCTATVHLSLYVDTQRRRETEGENPGSDL